MPSVGDATAAVLSPSTSTRTGPAAAPRVAYHYEKKNSSPPASSPSSAQLVSRRGSTQEAAQAIATIGKSHKPNFSIGAFLGGAPHSTLGGFNPPSRQIDPKPSRSSSSGGIREQFSGGQGPNTSPGLGGGSNLTSATTAKLRALEASDHTGQLRNSSSLKLKMPILKRIGRANSTLVGSKQSEPPRSSSSLRPLSPFSLRSPVIEGRPQMSSRPLTLDAVPLGRPGPSRPYLSPNHPPLLEEAPVSISDSPTFSATSTASTQDEPLPLTPRTLRSGKSLPKSLVASELSPSKEQIEGDLSDDGFLRDDTVTSTVIEQSAEFLKTRIGPFPTITQDDLSLERHNLAEKHIADNRVSRRASVSVTSMLSSTSSTSSQHPGSNSGGGDADGRGTHQRSAPTTLAVPNAGFPEDQQHGSSLSPITFESLPSPDLDLVGLSSQDLPTPRLPPPLPSGHPSYEDDSGVPTPIATTNPEMPFSTFVVPISQHSHDSTTHSNPHSRSVSRASSSDVDGSRNSLSEAGHSRSDTFSHKIEKISPVQLALWEKDRERITRDVMEAYEGEACLIRFEPKQGWIGFWNRSDVDKVIDELRELRSPKP